MIFVFYFKIIAFAKLYFIQAAFSLEYLCSSEGIGSTAERLEVVLCNVLIPLFLRAATVKNGFLLLTDYDANHLDDGFDENFETSNIN